MPSTLLIDKLCVDLFQFQNPLLHILNFNLIPLYRIVQVFDLINKFGFNLILIEYLDLQLIFISLNLLLIILNLLLLIFYFQLQLWISQHPLIGQEGLNIFVRLLFFLYYPLEHEIELVEDLRGWKHWREAEFRRNLGYWLCLFLEIWVQDRNVVIKSLELVSEGGRRPLFSLWVNRGGDVCRVLLAITLGWSPRVPTQLPSTLIALCPPSWSSPWLLRFGPLVDDRLRVDIESSETIMLLLIEFVVRVLHHGVYRTGIPVLPRLRLEVSGIMGVLVEPRWTSALGRRLLWGLAADLSHVLGTKLLNEKVSVNTVVLLYVIKHLFGLTTPAKLLL